ncbi:hypothetical protein [Gilliamella sp. wkB308]|uniref:hypothetical protein n=1 Tax=Gilliamella sp. wkB308 TaxID=3120263 RepID=UPI00080DDDFA|nr:hypothetical protein [Gilliamella apicola]OCF95894.1 hypothetical protein A9G10_10445 [Gilliamella apicola]
MMFQDLEKRLLSHHLVISLVKLAIFSWSKRKITVLTQKLFFQVLTKIGVMECDQQPVRSTSYHDKSSPKTAVTKGIIKPNKIIISNTTLFPEKHYHFESLSNYLLNNIVIFLGKLIPMSILSQYGKQAKFDLKSDMKTS